VVSLIAFFDEITLDDTARVGGKGANLGHLTRAGYDVPPGFCVLASAYDAFISSNDLEPRIMGIIGDLHLEDLEAVEAGMERVRGLIECAEVPPGIEDEIREAYRRLIRSAGVPDARALVAVRSSVGTRDLSATSFPGQMDTYHNVRGEDDVIDKVSRCWASAFSYSATVNRRARGIDHMDVFVAPLVQMMVQPETAGVVFTANPLSGRRDQMVVNSCLGLGEGVVSGEVEADHLVLDRETLDVLEETTGDKRVKFVLDEGSGCGVLRVAVEGEEARSQCLTSAQVTDLGATAREIDELYGRPQDVEWAYEGGRLYILQSRAASMPDVEAAGAAGREHGGAQAGEDGEHDDHDQGAPRHGEGRELDRLPDHQREHDAERDPERGADQRRDDALVADHAPHLALRHADGAQHPQLARPLEHCQHERVHDAEEADDHRE